MAKTKSHRGKIGAGTHRSHKKASKAPKRRGRRRGFKHSKATRDKISRKLRAYWKSRHHGKKLSPEKAVRGKRKPSKTKRKPSKTKRKPSKTKASRKRAQAPKKASRRRGPKPGHCAICGVPIFGGPKGMATHTRKRHREHIPGAVTKSVMRHKRKAARKAARAPKVKIAPAASGFSPELRARLMARKAAMASTHKVLPGWASS